MKSCAVAGCERADRLIRGWCNAHYKRWLNHGDPEGGAPMRNRKRPTCSVSDCDREHYGNGYCMLHYTRHRAHGDPHTVLPPSGPPPAPPQPPCSIDGCNRASKVRSRALCGMHEARRRRHGTPLWEPPSREERFWSFVDVGHPLGCWQWVGATLPTGYGQFHNLKPHRVAYELLMGAIPEDMTLDHLCRNRACVNPDHLEPVTQGVNNLRGYGVSGVNARKVRCIRGHLLAGDNVYHPPSRPNARVCLACMREYRRARRRKAAA